MKDITPMKYIDDIKYEEKIVSKTPFISKIADLAENVRQKKSCISLL